MTDPDRLAEWRARVARFEAQSIDLARLPDNPEVQEAANLAAWQAAGALRAAVSEVERLRGLLERLEWGGTNPRNPINPHCPACGGWPANGHYPGCAWVAIMHPERQR
jgi:hypothetical protein